MACVWLCSGLAELLREEVATRDHSSFASNDTVRFLREFDECMMLKVVVIEKLVLGVPPVLLQWPQRLVLVFFGIPKIEERRIRSGLVSCESAMGGGED
ncbi:hypothetical protein NC652_007287 [Populus alba x Populus x berolinensis]|nr:hypothetical protein NC652_007287 [Populus alba x Populus x berolinensis]